MKKTLFSLLVVVMLLAILVPVAAAMPAPVGQERGASPTIICHVVGNPPGYSKTTMLCPYTMNLYTYDVGYGVTVSLNTNTWCGRSYRRITSGGFIGKYVWTSDTTCAQ